MALGGAWPTAQVEGGVGEQPVLDWLRSRWAAAPAHEFPRQLVITLSRDVREFWFWLSFCDAATLCNRLGVTVLAV